MAEKTWRPHVHLRHSLTTRKSNALNWHAQLRNESSNCVNRSFTDLLPLLNMKSPSKLQTKSTYPPRSVLIKICKIADRQAKRRQLRSRFLCTTSRARPARANLNDIRANLLRSYSSQNKELIIGYT